MTKTYELPNGRKMTADFDENGICKVTVQALDSLVNELNKYASEECDNDCEHCAYLECPKEPCEDAVSRQAILDKLNEWEWQELYLPIHFKENIIDELPSVQPKAKTGRREYNDIYDHYLCGNCKTIVADYDNYCPNCGAEMKGGAE